MLSSNVIHLHRFMCEHAKFDAIGEGEVTKMMYGMLDQKQLLALRAFRMLLYRAIGAISPQNFYG